MSSKMNACYKPLPPKQMLQRYFLDSAPHKLIDRLMSIDQKYMKYAWTSKQWKSYLETYKSKSLVFLICDPSTEQIKSFALYLVGNIDQEDSYMHLLKIATATEERSKGYATQLIEKSVLYALGERVQRIHLEVAHNNDVALTFYEKAGFKKERFIKHFYSDGVNAYCLSMDLTQEILKVDK